MRVRLPKDRFRPEFVSLFLNSAAGRKQMIEKAKTTTGLYTLSTSKVCALEIPAPPLTEQTKATERLQGETAAAKRLSQSLVEELTALDHLPAALLREAFDGRH